jgi:hypothetical protein
MPTKNRIKDTQNMSLHLHNPYIVSMQGSLKTNGLSDMLCVGGGCGRKDGVHEPGAKPGEDEGRRPEDEGRRPEPQQQMPVQRAPPKWKKVEENGHFLWVDHERKMLSYSKPEGWSENEANTEARQDAAKSQTAQNAESQESSRFKHCTAFYLPVECNFLVSYLNMTDHRSFGWMLSIIMLSIAKLFSEHKTSDDANEEEQSKILHTKAKTINDGNEEAVSETDDRRKSLLDFIEKQSFDENVMFKLSADMKERELEQSRLFLEKMQQVLHRYSESAKSSSRESESAKLNDYVLESWTYKCNTQSIAAYDAVHLVFTDKDARKENFYLFTKRGNDSDKHSSSAKTNQKYLFVYDGTMEELRSQMQDIAKVDTPKPHVFTTLIEQMDDLYEETKPGADGVSYYECKYATDAGYWHDSAQRILMQYHAHGLQQPMDKFVRAIAKRLFDHIY